MKIKEEYSEVEIELIRFLATDILTISGDTGGEGEGGDAGEDIDL